MPPEQIHTFHTLFCQIVIICCSVVVPYSKNISSASLLSQCAAINQHLSRSLSLFILQEARAAAAAPRGPEEDPTCGCEGSANQTGQTKWD